MIKNQKQAGITNARLAELKKAKETFEEQHKDKTTAKYRLGINSMNSLIAELENDIQIYEGLMKNNFNILQAKSINELPNVLIGARLAQNMSHKELGELVGVKEQQIQRYEATDYETASLPRIIEISMALNLNMKFEKNIIINMVIEDEFEYSDNLTKELVSSESEKIRNRKSLMVI
jgi:HTH-type transcriptional regulator / antitoxin HipB